MQSWVGMLQTLKQYNKGTTLNREASTKVCIQYIIIRMTVLGMYCTVLHVLRTRQCTYVHTLQRG